VHSYSAVFWQEQATLASDDNDDDDDDVCFAVDQNVELDFNTARLQK
jgi:hypothetical protein